MKYYLASRMKHREMVNKLILVLKQNGHTMSYEWSALGSLAPYREHAEESRNVSLEISKAILDTDIFILISDQGGTDMFVELGIMIAACHIDSTKKIYIVGEYNQRSLMQLHPFVTHVDTVEQVLSLQPSND